MVINFFCLPFIKLYYFIRITILAHYWYIEPYVDNYIDEYIMYMKQKPQPKMVNKKSTEDPQQKNFEADAELPELQTTNFKLKLAFTYLSQRFMFYKGTHPKEEME